jgi:SEC-C motif-containing protein
MRSRYSAFINQDADYLRKSWHPATCPASINLDPEQRWLGLKVTGTSLGGADDKEGEVAFVARYKVAGKGHRLEENSSFTRIGGQWVYVGRVID